MTEYLKQCYKLADDVLRIIKDAPFFSRRLAVQNIPSDKWDIDHVFSQTYIEYNQFKDILVILKKAGYIEYDKETIEITPEGRIFILDDGYGKSEQSDNIIGDIIDYEESESGLLVPKNSTGRKKAVAFEDKIPDVQKKRLIDFFTEGEYVNDPAGLVDFLCGKNDGKGLELNPHKDKLTELCLVLEALDNKEWLILTFGKGYQKFFEERIRPFSQKKEKGQQIKSKVKRVNNKSWDKNTRKDFKDFLHSLKILYILYLFS